MRVDPERSARAMCACHPSERAERDRVITPEHERQVTLPDSTVDMAGNALAHRTNLREESCAFVTRLCCFGSRGLDIAEIDRLVTDLLQPRIQTGIANGRRSHVNTAPPGAEVERRTDYGDLVTRRLHGSADKANFRR